MNPDGKKKIMLVFGTRPEATKMAPLIMALRNDASLEPFVVVLRQHKEVPQILSFFGVKPDKVLGVELSDRGAFSKNPFLKGAGILKSGIGLLKFYRLLGSEKPAVLLVQGDTSAAFLAAFMAYNRRIPVGHVEAGLRTYDKYAPFPEEMNRQLIGRIADYHFAPTARAKENLLREGITEDRIVVVGNTALDTLRLMLEGQEETRKPSREFGDKFILVTAHRRESFEGGLSRICDAILELAERHPDIHFVYPVHHNPNVREVVFEKLNGKRNIHLIPPVPYEEFVGLMRDAHLVLTDSGGIQEEISFFGTPCLVLRDVTERPEGVEAGNIKLVGTNAETIVREVEELLGNEGTYRNMARKHTAFGDGHAAEKIVAALRGYLLK